MENANSKLINLRKKSKKDRFKVENANSNLINLRKKSRKERKIIPDSNKFEVI